MRCAILMELTEDIARLARLIRSSEVVGWFG